MKGKILQALKAKDSQIVSGERLSAELGISRVSVWKHIHGLQELGYDISSTPKGYRLAGSPDIPYPWEFPELESGIHYYPKLESTMDTAKDLARKGCPHFSVVIAGSQSKGRGRLKRPWKSAAGGLYFTIVLRPQIPPVLSHRLNFAASFTLVRTLRDLFGIEAMAKWPNDILVDGGKLAGMLSEMETEADMVAYLNIGIGLNVNNDTSRVKPKACSLKQLLGRDVNRKEILSLFLTRFKDKILKKNLENIIQDWKRYNITRNRYVRIEALSEVTEGLAVDVDENGALLLEMSDGSIKRIIYGDCFLEDR